MGQNRSCLNPDGGWVRKKMCMIYHKKFDIMHGNVHPTIPPLPMCEVINSIWLYIKTLPEPFLLNNNGRIPFLFGAKT